MKYCVSLLLSLVCFNSHAEQFFNARISVDLAAAHAANLARYRPADEDFVVSLKNGRGTVLLQQAVWGRTYPKLEFSGVVSIDESSDFLTLVVAERDGKETVLTEVRSPDSAEHFPEYISETTYAMWAQVAGAPVYTRTHQSVVFSSNKGIFQYALSDTLLGFDPLGASSIRPSPYREDSMDTLRLQIPTDNGNIETMGRDVTGAIRTNSVRKLSPELDQALVKRYAGFSHFRFQIAAQVELSQPSKDVAIRDTIATGDEEFLLSPEAERRVRLEAQELVAALKEIADQETVRSGDNAFSRLIASYVRTLEQSIKTRHPMNSLTVSLANFIVLDPSCGVYGSTRLQYDTTAYLHLYRYPTPERTLASETALIRQTVLAHAEGKPFRVTCRETAQDQRCNPDYRWWEDARMQPELDAKTRTILMKYMLSEFLDGPTMKYPGIPENHDVVWGDWPYSLVVGSGQ